MRERESGSVQGMAAYFLIIVVFAVLYIALSPMLDAFLNAPNSLAGLPITLERLNAINTVKTTWWLWPLIVLILGGLYYWKEAIKKRSGEA